MKKAILSLVILLFSFHPAFSQDVSKGVSKPGRISFKIEKASPAVLPSDIRCDISFSGPSKEPLLRMGEQGVLSVTVRNLHPQAGIQPALFITAVRADSAAVPPITARLRSLGPNEADSYQMDLKPDPTWAPGVTTYRARAVDVLSGVSSETVQVSLVVEETAAEKRLALVIGNSNYIHSSPLRNPENDAEDFAEKLKSLGFEVHLFLNCPNAELGMKIDAFGLELQNYDVGLFYYAGHGAQARGINYLFPVDAHPQMENQVEYQCVRLDRVLDNMEGSGCGTNIVILDACRDNPFERSWTRSAKGRGLAVVETKYRGMWVAYSTAPGATAMDGLGRNSPYTQALLDHIGAPGVPIESVFKRVRSEVIGRTENKQVPWESTMLTGEFYFVR